MSEIQTERITQEGFSPFGKVVLRPDKPPTAKGEEFEFWSDIASYHLEGETEIGLCTVFRLPGHKVGWMERHHKTPEILVPIDAPFVLPVMRDRAIRAFRVEVGEAVVLDPGAWHSACLPADKESATYFVIFRRGTPNTDVEKTTTEPVVVAA